jgi:hypothetical protein
MDRDGGHCILNNAFDFRQYYDDQETDEDDIDDSYSDVTDDDDSNSNDDDIIDHDDNDTDESKHIDSEEHSIDRNKYNDDDSGHGYSGIDTSGNKDTDDDGNDDHDSDDDEDSLANTLQSKNCRQQWTKDRTAAEEELGISVSVAEDFGSKLLFTTNFEEFLVRTYFEEWAFFCERQSHNGRTDLPPALEEYLFRVYTKEGRNIRD